MIKQYNRYVPTYLLVYCICMPVPIHSNIIFMCLFRFHFIVPLKLIRKKLNNNNKYYKINIIVHVNVSHDLNGLLLCHWALTTDFNDKYTITFVSIPTTALNY